MTNDTLTWGDASGAQFLKKDDINPGGQVVTIAKFEMTDIEDRDGGLKQKVCVHFEGVDKPLVLNSTNANALKLFTGAEVPLDAIGKKVEMYVDPSVSFGGQIMGGIRFRPA
jgi:hypothetical protein